MKIHTLKTVLIPLMLLVSAQANAACGLTITAGNIIVNWGLSFSTQAVSFTLTKSSAATCDYWIGFTKGGAASSATRRMDSGLRTLPYQLYKDNGYTKVLKDSTDAPITTVDEVINGSFPAGANITQTLLYFFDIPANGSITPTIIKDGTYSDTFTMNVYEGNDPLVAGPTPVTSATVTATTSVPKMIQMSMVSTGGAFDSSSVNRSINFGALAAGQFNTFDLRVYTNAGFSVSFSSANNGVLRKPAVLSGPGVPYLFYANGALLNLSSSASVPVVGITASGQTALQGLGYPIRIQIGNFSSTLLVGGAAQDVILVTATTTE